jgi:hypothetical protein
MSLSDKHLLILEEEISLRRPSGPLGLICRRRKSLLAGFIFPGSGGSLRLTGRATVVPGSEGRRNLTERHELIQHY